MASKRTTSLTALAAALQLAAALVLLGCHRAGRCYYTISPMALFGFVTFARAFRTCLVFVGDGMFAFLPPLRFGTVSSGCCATGVLSGSVGR